jgi:hypothetical protein
MEETASASAGAAPYIKLGGGNKTGCVGGRNDVLKEETERGRGFSGGTESLYPTFHLFLI